MDPGKKRRQRQDGRIHHIDPQIQKHIGNIEKPHHPCRSHGHGAKHLNVRRQKFIDQKIQIGHQTYHAVFGIGQDPLVPYHALIQPDVPPPPLPAQI